MRIDFSPALCDEVHVNLTAMSEAPMNDPARARGKAALAAMNGTKFESANFDALKAVESALDWIASPFGAELPAAVKKAAKVRLDELQRYLSEK